MDNNNNDKWKTQHKHTYFDPQTKQNYRRKSVERKTLILNDVHEFRLEKGKVRESSHPTGSTAMLPVFNSSDLKFFHLPL